MTTQGCHSKVIKVTNELYGKAETHVKIDKEGPRFEIKRGVKQGDPLSPNFFICVLEDILRELDWEQRGVAANGRRINNLMFADDIILIATSAREVQEMGAKKVGYSQKYMSNAPDSQVIIEETNIEKVEECTY